MPEQSPGPLPRKHTLGAERIHGSTRGSPHRDRGSRGRPCPHRCQGHVSTPVTEHRRAEEQNACMRSVLYDTDPSVTKMRRKAVFQPSLEKSGHGEEMIKESGKWAAGGTSRLYLADSSHPLHRLLPPGWGRMPAECKWCEGKDRVRKLVFSPAAGSRDP